jgi:hypothetical protein
VVVREADVENIHSWGCVRLIAANGDNVKSTSEVVSWSSLRTLESMVGQRGQQTDCVWLEWTVDMDVDVAGDHQCLRQD